jgi:PAS domain S-box-containing protein
VNAIDRTRERLLSQLTELRLRVAELEAHENDRDSITKALDACEERVTGPKGTEEDQRQSELRYREVVNDQTELICRWRPGGELTFVNEAYCRYFGKKREELIGTNLLSLIPVEDHASVKEHFDSINRDNPLGMQEHHVISPSGEIRWQQWVNRGIFDSDGHLAEYQSVGRDITERKRTELELQRSREQLRNLAAHFQDVREQERVTIAREIHDEVGQAMTALKIGLNRLAKRLPEATKSVRDMIANMSELTDETIQTMQRICAELRPGLLDDVGLAAAIEWQAGEFQKRMGICCEVSLDPVDTALDQDHATAMFRIFQEALTNVARHAEATIVKASLNQDARELVLIVQDNGKGITADQVSDSTSFGLIGMRERVHPWGGSVAIRGVEGKGTTVTVRLPAGNVRSGT